MTNNKTKKIKQKKIENGLIQGIHIEILQKKKL